MADFTPLLFLLLKVFSLILLFLHMAFSLILVQRTKIMIKVVEAKISPVIYAISLAHLLSSVFVFLFGIIFL